MGGASGRVLLTFVVQHGAVRLLPDVVALIEELHVLQVLRRDGLYARGAGAHGGWRGRVLLLCASVLGIDSTLERPPII